MISEGWYERSNHEWMLTDAGNFVIGSIRHYPTGWRLRWRPSKRHQFEDRWFSDLELEEAKAWGLAMIRMQ